MTHTHIAANAKWAKIIEYMKERRYWGSGVAMYASEQLHPVTVKVYAVVDSSLRLTRNGDDVPNSDVAAPMQVVHRFHKNGNHFDLFPQAPAVDTFLGRDISKIVADGVASMKKPACADAPTMKRPACAEAISAPPTKRAAHPPRHVVLNAVASMSGAQSGGKTKAIKKLGQLGIKKTLAKSALKKLEDGKAIRHSQTVRTLQDGRKWKALRVDKNKHLAANMFHI